MLVDEITHAASIGNVNDYILADVLVFSSPNHVKQHPTPKSEISVVATFPLISMATVVNLNSWFSGFTGISAAVPDRGGSSLVWLDSFAVPIFPYKIESSIEAAVHYNDLHPTMKNTTSKDALAELGNARFVEPVSWLGEYDANVPLAYVEFSRVKNSWENDYSVSISVKSISIATAVAATAFLVLTCCLFDAGARLRRKWNGYTPLYDEDHPDFHRSFSFQATLL